MRKLHSILCPTDFSEFSDRAYRHALSVAWHYGAKLFVQHIIELWKYPYADFAACLADYDNFCRVMSEGGKEQLQQFVKIYAHYDIQPELAVQQGMAADCILVFAENQRTDLIVMGTHGRRGFDRLMLGSVTERVMRRASCPVLAVNQPSQQFLREDEQSTLVHMNRILFCTDFSENSRRALDHAISIRTEYDAELTLLHVLEDTPHPAKIQKAMAVATQQLDSLVPAETRQTGKIKTMVRVGKAYQQIVQFALEAKVDLVVLAVRGRGALDLAVFGSTTHRVMQFAPCPVFVVHV